MILRRSSAAACRPKSARRVRVGGDGIICKFAPRWPLATMAGTHTIVSADTLTGEPFVLRMPSHEAGLELAAARLLAAEFRVSTAEVDELLRPPQAAIMQTAEERAALHDKLVARGLQANREGAVAKAAGLFWEAWRLDQRKPSTLISMLNMHAA